MDSIFNFRQFCSSEIECFVSGNVEKWKITWENGEPKSLLRKVDESSDALAYTTSDFMFDPFIKIHFVRDLQEGFKERIEVFFNEINQEIVGDIRRNAQSGYFDDWDLQTIYYSSKENSPQCFSVNTKLEGQFFSPQVDITIATIHRKSLDTLEITLLGKTLPFEIQNPQGSALIGKLQAQSGPTYYVELHHEIGAPMLEETAVLYKEIGEVKSQKQTIGQILVFNKK